MVEAVTQILWKFTIPMVYNNLSEGCPMLTGMIPFIHNTLKTFINNKTL